MRGIGRVVVGVGALLAIAAIPTTLTVTSVSAADDPAALITASRHASGNLDAEVEIRWRPGKSVKSAQVHVRADNGSFWVGDEEWTAGGDGRSLWVSKDGVTTKWTAENEVTRPDPDAHWDLVMAGKQMSPMGSVIDLIDARDNKGRRRVRLGIDQASGLEVSREVYSLTGDLVHSVRLVPAATDSAVTSPPPSAPDGKSDSGSVPDTADDFLSPNNLDRGFKLLARYEFPNNIRQSFYSDGIFTLSIFEQNASIDWDALPASGRAVNIGNANGRWYVTASGSVVVWADGDHGFTSISDAPPDVVVAAVRPMRPRSLSETEKIVDFVTGPFGWN